MVLSGGDAQIQEIARKLKDAQTVDVTATEFLDFTTGGKKLFGTTELGPRLCAVVASKKGAIVGCYTAHRTEQRRARDRIVDLYEKNRDRFEGGGGGVDTYIYGSLDAPDPFAYEVTEKALVGLLREITGRRPEVKKYLRVESNSGDHAEVPCCGFLIENKGGGAFDSTITWLSPFIGSGPSTGARGDSLDGTDSRTRSGQEDYHSNREL